MAAQDKHSKTLPPSAKKLREAKREGKVARSPELSSWLAMLVATYVIPPFFRDSAARLTGLFNLARLVGQQGSPGPAAALRVLESGLGDFVALVMPIAGGFMVLAIFLNVVQVGFVLATKAVTPSFRRLSLKGGVQRLFNPQQGLWEAAKSVAKFVFVGGIAYHFVYELMKSVVGTRPVAIEPLLAFAGVSVLGLVRAVAFAGLGLAVVDYAFRRYNHRRSLMMSRVEAQEEVRRSEGDPVRRRRIRQRQRQLSRLRMMAALVHADVVVVNPSHFLVALRYESGATVAPVVVAKGMDELAARLREEAMKLCIPIVEDAPLARALYAACDVDELIPPELYVAVARLLAFVYALPKKVRTLGVVHRPARSVLAEVFA